MLVRSKADYEALRSGAQVLCADNFGDKVLHLADGRMLKLFRQRHWFSSARLWPYAQRFATNAARLHQLGIPTVTVIDVSRIPDIDRDAVLYQPLDGITLRDLAAEPGTNPPPPWPVVAVFLAHLHQLGIIFRSIHFNNILIQPDGTLGLIDVADMQFRRRPLRTGERIRNFRHFLRRETDCRSLIGFGLPRFLDAYLVAAELPARTATRLRHALLASDQVSC